MISLGNWSPKRINTRRNPDPNPPEVVEDLEKILRRNNNKTDKETFHLQRSLSLPAEGIQSIDDIIFNEKFEQMLFRCKSCPDLSQVIFDQERFISFTPKVLLNSQRKIKKHFGILYLVILKRTF